KDLDEELWKLGICAKTEHNEVAPAQHELAPIFTTSNVAADQNALTMEIMKKLALKHGLVCLLHEKPFAGVNGSGKHNNWSMNTNFGENLLDPGDSPKDNIQFLTFLIAIIKAVDEYADLLRLSVASASNDHRLGANEAPPAIISIFMGSEIQQILDALETGEMIKSNESQEFVIGVEALPNFPKDNTDRNRTSPFAFTGNKFEFRSLGSSDTISCTNTILNTIVANSLREFADRLEGSTDFKKDLNTVLCETLKKHKRVIFNGNGYDASWVEEAARRGLPNYVSTVDAMPHYTDDKNVKLFESFRVYSRTELQARTDALLENYSRTINIEALTMLDMAKKQILPTGIRYASELAKAVNEKKAAGIDASLEIKLASRVSEICSSLDDAVNELDSLVIAACDIKDILGSARYYRDTIFSSMQSLRAVADELEMNVPEDMWPFPTYGDLMFRV
ncbi:MAG: glutamine synthetase type III, partial [Oscillospiraceae bacterium]|nr:glutamine synthetase type III [Oscillospiraceae bacterium]